MSFYNNIFASTYLFYEKYERGAKFSAVSFVYLCMLGAVSVIVGIVKRVFELNLTSIRRFSDYKIVAIAFCLCILIILYKYYSPKMTETILSHFVSKSQSHKRIWGFISITHFILQWVLFSILVS
jgi:hypothetical protein